MTPKKRTSQLVNPGDAGVVYDRQGHSLGGGERIDAPELDPVGQAAVDGGRLLLRETPDTPQPPPEQRDTSAARHGTRRDDDAGPGASDTE